MWLARPQGTAFRDALRDAEDRRYLREHPHLAWLAQLAADVALARDPQPRPVETQCMRRGVLEGKCDGFMGVVHSTYTVYTRAISESDLVQDVT